MLDHFNKLSFLITEASQQGALDQNEILTGLSGKKLMGTLQRFSNHLVNEENCYLEVGVFQGLTLLSVALSTSKGQVYGIDNFAYFDKEGKNFSIVKERKKKLNLNNVNIINKDYEEALENLNKYIDGKKVAVYFVDGPHDYRSQLLCLTLIKPFLSSNAVIVIDDCNYNQVRQANRDFLITNPEFKLLYQSYTEAHPMNLDLNERKKAEQGWWNGVNIIVLDPTNNLESMYPPCFKEKTLFENEQLLHTSKFPLAFEENRDMIVKIEKLRRKLKRKTAMSYSIVGKFDRMNTYSEELTKGELNPAVKMS